MKRRNDEKVKKKLKILKRYYNLFKRSKFHITNRSNRPLHYFPLMATKSIREPKEDSLSPRRYLTNYMHFIFYVFYVTDRKIFGEITNELTEDMKEDISSHELDLSDRENENLKTPQFVSDDLDQLSKISKPGSRMFPIPRIG